MEKLEEIIAKIEREKNFERVVELFGEGAALVKKSVAAASGARGKMYEIIRDGDLYIERAMEGTTC
jgi:exonuclease VII small subunit